MGGKGVPNSDQVSTKPISLAGVHVIGVGETEQEPVQLERSYSDQMALLERQVERLKVQDGSARKEAAAAAAAISAADEGGSSASEEEDFNVFSQLTSVSETSDSASSGPVQTGAHLYFQNGEGAWLSIYRDAIPSRGASGTDEDIAREIASFRQPRTWLVLMCTGGRFAGAVIKDGKVIAHKGFQRYVIRAKRGTVQSSQDAKGNAPKSAGATLRRYNEAELKKDIRGLVASWASYADEAEIIFLKISVNTKAIFFGENKSSPGCFDRKDSRVRNIPFPTGKPTLEEVTKAYARLSAVYKLDSQPAFYTEWLARQASAAATPNVAASGTEELAEAKAPQPMPEAQKPEDADAYVNSKLYLAAEAGDGALVRQLLAGEVSDGCALDYAWNDGGHTALHVAARKGHSEVVRLLLESGADPTIGNYRGQPAYSLANEKPCRDAFRRHMAMFPDKFDWAAAKVPSPLTDELEQAQAKKQKEKEKKERQRQKAKQKAKDKKERLMKEQQLEKQRDAIAANAKKGPKLSQRASAREKMAAAAMARLQANSQAPSAVQEDSSQGRCAYCNKGIAKGGLIFHRFTYQYCAMDCLTRHKAALETR